VKQGRQFFGEKPNPESWDKRTKARAVQKTVHREKVIERARKNKGPEVGEMPENFFAVRISTPRKKTAVKPKKGTKPAT